MYKSFRLRDITPQEWVQLPTEVSLWFLRTTASVDHATFVVLPLQTTQALIKETLVGRKNTSPQNVYETGQLYACGALKAACIGLQCIGFDEQLYRALLVQAEACTKSGRWRGLGSGTAWNAGANPLGMVPVEVDGEKSPYN